MYCSHISIEEMLTPMFEQMQFVVEFPPDIFSDYNCLSLKASLKFYNESGQEEAIIDYEGDRFTRFNSKSYCNISINVTEVVSLPKYQEIKVSKVFVYI